MGASIWVAALLLATLCFTGCRPAGETDPREKWAHLMAEQAPEGLSVVLITVDTLRADRIGSYGDRRAETPAIDALAAEGTRFANAAATVPFTLPSHSSIMTGTYPPYHGVRENVGYFLDESIPTLAELLAKNGYATAGFVSAFVLDSRWGIGRGFERYFDEFRLEEHESANLGSVQRDGRETVDEALRWLDEKPQGKFFLWLHLFDPHDPYEPPEPFRSRHPNRPYEAEVSYTDSLVGEFRQALEEKALLDRSLTILTGDHGEGLGDHGERFHGFFVYDSTVHVPLIIRSPAGAFGGRVVDQAVSHVDLLPTILESIGLGIPEHAQGESLFPLLLGGEGEAERTVYSESLYPLLHYGWAPLRTLRTASFKFIDAPDAELYDLGDDAGERQNVVQANGRQARALKDRLDALSDEIESNRLAAGRLADLDEETLAQLSALGYIAGQGGITPEDEDETIERSDPKDKIRLHQLIMAAQSALGGEGTEVAEAMLREVLESDPTIVDAHQMLGTIARQRQELEQAVEHFQRALELDSDHKLALLGLASAYMKLGRKEEGAVGFQRLLDLNPNDTAAALGLARFYVDQGKRQEAISVLQEATRSADASAALFNELGELLVAEGRPDEAREKLERAVANSDEMPQARFNLAVLYEEEGRIDEAIALYEEAVAQAPRHFEAQFNLGRLLGQRGEVEREQALYEAALESNPEFIRGYFFLAKLLMDRGGDLARAEQLTRHGLEKDPEHRTGPLGLYLLADILNRRGAHAEAQEAVRQAQQVQAGGGT